MSPPRLAQLRESVTDYLSSTTMEQDCLWQLLGQEICTQMRVDVTNPEAVEEVYRGLKDNPILWSKGEKAIPCLIECLSLSVVVGCVFRVAVSIAVLFLGLPLAML